MKDHYGLDRVALDRWLTTEPDYDYEQHDIEAEYSPMPEEWPKCWRCADTGEIQVIGGEGPHDTIACAYCNSQDEADIPW